MTADQNVDAPTPTDPRHQAANQSMQARSRYQGIHSTSSAPFSPQGSSTFPDSPTMTTYLDTSPMSSPSSEPTIDPSIVAVHGSAPSSPVLKGMRGDRLKDSGYFALPHRNLVPSAPVDLPNGRTQNGNGETVLDSTSPAAPVPAPLPARDTNTGDVQSGRNEEDKSIEAAPAPAAPIERALPDHHHRTAATNRVIAIDFDDVCSQSMAALCQAHNALHGTDLTANDMETYLPFQNRGWGTPLETKQKRVNMPCPLPQTLPVLGFAAALKHLHSLGHPLHIVTARPPIEHNGVVAWLAEHGITVGLEPDNEVAAIWCARHSEGQHIDAMDKEELTLEEANEKVKADLKRVVEGEEGGLAKLKVLRAINASLFIDDCLSDLEPIFKVDPPIPCLLFGAYKWNATRSGLSIPVDFMSYDERIAAGLALPRQDIELGGYLHRAKDWNEVIDWVKKWDAPQMGRTETA